jgi:plastocyanin
MYKTIAVLATSIVVAGGCSGDSSGIRMEARDFVPETFRVQAGSTITFTNDSDETHTVTALENGLPNGATYFASGDFSGEEDARDDLGDGLIDPGDGYEIALEESGTYHYVCLPHESQGMRGTIIVEE